MHVMSGFRSFLMHILTGIIVMLFSHAQTFMCTLCEVSHYCLWNTRVLVVICFCSCNNMLVASQNKARIIISLIINVIVM